jgi:hypothetical protein
MADLLRMDTEDLSRLTAHDFTLTKKGKLAVSIGDHRLTPQQLVLLVAIDYVQSLGENRERGQVYTLAGEPGICPVCKYDWASDLNNYCHCTAPHPGDAEEEAKAYAMSARHRTIKRQNDLTEALAADERVIRELGRSFEAQPSGSAAVIPIQQGRRKPGGKRKRSS